MIRIFLFCFYANTKSFLSKQFDIKLKSPILAYSLMDAIVPSPIPSSHLNPRRRSSVRQYSIRQYGFTLDEGNVDLPIWIYLG